jgi:hypothetical protein
MRCDSWASLLAYTLASPYLGYEPKAKVAIMYLCTHKTKIYSKNNLNDF